MLIQLIQTKYLERIFAFHPGFLKTSNSLQFNQNVHSTSFITGEVNIG